MKRLLSDIPHEHLINDILMPFARQYNQQMPLGHVSQNVFVNPSYQNSLFQLKEHDINAGNPFACLAFQSESEDFAYRRFRTLSSNKWEDTAMFSTLSKAQMDSVEELIEENESGY